MEAKCSAPARDWLSRHTRLPSGNRDALAELATALVARLPSGTNWLLGLGGPPGTGKTTLARLLAHLAGRQDAPEGPALVLSLDDYYLPRAARLALSERVHPLLRLRGVPGTHDTRLLFSHLDILAAGDEASLDVPRFDKGSDDRQTPPRTLPLNHRPARIILEGWFVGTPPQPTSDLAAPVNRLERASDPDGAWRRWVHLRLGEFHSRLAHRLDAVWHLAAPDWERIVDWRWAQEEERAFPERGLPDREAVAAFLAPFERLCRHQLARDADWADLRIRLDRDHRPRLESEP